MRAYVDVPFLASSSEAALLEVERGDAEQRSRRARPVMALLALAGLLRPEAWALVGAVLALVPR